MKNDFSGFNCILNFPHTHYDVEEIRDLDLFDCYVMTDESVEFMDARRSMKKGTMEMSYFGYQATKRNVDWHFDAVRAKNIDPRIRLNPHFWIETMRLPHDPRIPLMAVKMIITPRYGNKTRTIYLTEPWKYYPIYNHIVLVPPPED